MRNFKFRAWVYSGYEKDGNTFAKPTMFLNVQDFYDGNASYSKELKFSGYGFDTFGDLLEARKSHPDPQGKVRVIAVMQYTGLLDKAGKEIYEGDIVRAYSYIDEDEPEGNDFTIHVIEWCNDYPAFDLKPNPDHECNALQEFACDPMGEGYSIEVIGNIYENPELLKENNVQ